MSVWVSLAALAGWGCGAVSIPIVPEETFDGGARTVYFRVDRRHIPRRPGAYPAHVEERDLATGRLNGRLTYLIQPVFE